MNSQFFGLRKPSLLCLLLVSGVSAPLSSVQAGIMTIDVGNAGFDLPVGPVEYPITPFVTTQYLNDWTYYNPGDLNYLFGTFTPVDDEEFDLEPDDPNSPPAPVDGQIMYVDINPTNQQDNGSSPMGFEQALSDSLRAGTYELSVSVGNPQDTRRYDTNGDVESGFNYNGFGGYGIELLAGATVIGEDINGTTIDEGMFKTISFTVPVLDDHALLGQTLGIRLYNLNLDLIDASGNPITAASGIGFDNVALSFSPVPAPAAIWLFGSALLGMTGFNLRRKRAALKGSC